MQNVNFDEVMEAVQADQMVGFCLACGAERDCTEPDARGYECPVCGERKVYGAEEIMLMMVC